MFFKLSGLAGKALLFGVLGAGCAWAVSVFGEFGAAWQECMEDVEEMEEERRQAKERHCYGLIDGKYCYSKKEWDAHCLWLEEEKARKNEELSRAFYGPYYQRNQFGATR
jgi:hypothetical protein